MFETIWNFIQQQVTSNMFLSGGVMLGMLGGLLVYLRRIPSKFFHFIKRRFIFEIEVPDRDEAFQWLTAWLAEHSYRQRCRNVLIETRPIYDEAESGSGCLSQSTGDAAVENTDKSKARRKVLLTPAPGIHILFYRRRLLIIVRDRKDLDGKGGNRTDYREGFHITLFSRKRQLIYDLLDEAHKAMFPKREPRIKIFRSNYSEWKLITMRRPRSLQSVVLQNGLMEELVHDIDTFFQRRQWYEGHNIPYQRGYLLYGPPGNGKTSTVCAIASHLNLDIYTLQLVSDVDDNWLFDLISRLPPKGILLIEDVDCLFKKRKKEEKMLITFSGFLNAIDGIVPAEGRLLFLTTNQRHLLDKALLRPGRIDKQICFDNATPEQAARLFTEFFPASNKADLFGKCLTKATSMATLQEHLIKFQNNEDLCLTEPLYSV